MSDAPPQDRLRTVSIAEINPAELAVRMCEASYEITRPAGADAVAALAAMDDDCRDGWMRAAKAAFDYFQDALSRAAKVQ